MQLRTVAGTRVGAAIVAVLRVGAGASLMALGGAIVGHPLIDKGADFTVTGSAAGLIVFASGYMVVFPTQARELFRTGRGFWKDRKGS